MGIPKILWLEDQHEDFAVYKNVLFRSGYLVENVKSVSETEKKLREYDYIAVIFDIKVLTGDDVKWIQFNEQEREENPDIDSNLGFEHSKLLNSMDELYTNYSRFCLLKSNKKIPTKIEGKMCVLHLKNPYYPNLHKNIPESFKIFWKGA
jgi:hypothetical protein